MKRRGFLGALGAAIAGAGVAGAKTNPVKIEYLESDDGEDWEDEDWEDDIYDGIKVEPEPDPLHIETSSKVEQDLSEFIGMCVAVETGGVIVPAGVDIGVPNVFGIVVGKHEVLSLAGSMVALDMLRLSCSIDDIEPGHHIYICEDNPGHLTVKPPYKSGSAIYSIGYACDSHHMLYSTYLERIL